MKINHSLFFWGVCFILFLPIIVLPPTFQPADWSRAILFRIILTVSISFFLFKFFYFSKKEISISLPKWKSSVYFPFLMLLAFLATLILATIFSEDIRFSIFGSPARAGGLLNLLFFFIFTVFLTLFIKENDWKKLFSLLFAVGVLASSLAIIQYFNILKNIFMSYEGGAAPSFLGNSTFLAIYMLFLTFLSFTFLTQEKEKKKKVIYAVLFLIFAFTILITGSRATYLGLLVGFFYFFFFYPKKFKTLKIAAASLLLFAVFIVLLFNFFSQSAEKNNILKMTASRLSIKTIATDLMGTRFSAWKITVNAIKEKPLFGWGPENFYIGFEKYFDPTLPPSLQRLWWDRPHNVFLEIFINSGVFALIFYIAFWLILLWQLQRFKRKQDDSKHAYLAHGLQVMFIGYLVALFFNFDNFSTHLISFFFVGYSFYLISETEEKIIVCPPQNKIIQKKSFFIILLLLVILFIWFWNIKPLYLNEKIVYVQNLSEAKQCKKALEIVNDSNWEKSGILKSYAILRYSDIIRNCVFGQPEKEIEYSQKALSLLKIASNIQPKFSRTWLFMGGFTNVLAAREKNIENKNKLLLEAMGYLEKSLWLSPKRQEIFIEMEKNYIVAEDYQAMKKIAEDCIKIDPGVGECYWYLGIAEIFLGDQENGRKHIQESKEKNYNNPAYLQLGVAYISQKNYKDAAEAYHMLTAIYPKNASYHAVMAFLSQKIGDYGRAGAEALEVFKLQPNNKEAVKFLESLLGLNANDISLHTSLVYVYKQLGEEEKAKQELLTIKSIYLQLIANKYNASHNHFSLAGVYKELGEYENSFKEAMIALKLSPESREEIVSFIINNLPEGAKWLKK